MDKINVLSKKLRPFPEKQMIIIPYRIFKKPVKKLKLIKPLSTSK